jgi:hypothetical protein
LYILDKSRPLNISNESAGCPARARHVISTERGRRGETLKWR